MWNYRIVKRLNGLYALHEVYYNKAGEAMYMTNDPITFLCEWEEGSSTVISSLCMALSDAIRHPVFEEPITWGKEDS